jgi:hypothetical protein
VRLVTVWLMLRVPASAARHKYRCLERQRNGPARG